MCGRVTRRMLGGETGVAPPASSRSAAQGAGSVSKANRQVRGTASAIARRIARFHQLRTPAISIAPSGDRFVPLSRYQVTLFLASPVAIGLEEATLQIFSGERQKSKCNREPLGSLQWQITGKRLLEIASC